MNKNELCEVTQHSAFCSEGPSPRADPFLNLAYCQTEERIGLL